jgi:hypothetical protein
VFQVGSSQFTGSTSFDGNSVAGQTDIGINPNFDNEFDGEIADAFFYDTALTASQLSNIQQNGPSAIIGATAPEPSSVVLLGGGLVLIGGLLRRRRQDG